MAHRSCGAGIYFFWNTNMSQTFIVGDIHGGLRALVQVLNRVPADATDRFIFLGDLVDGWSESAQVVRFLMDFQEKHPCIFVRGNHDEYCYNWLRYEQVDELWLYHGGEATIRSYEQVDSDERLEHIAFFERMVNYWVDEREGYLYVHAGFTSMHGPHKEVHQSNYYWDRTLWEVARTAHGRIERGEEDYPLRLNHFERIIIGHTPVTQLGYNVPILRSNVWNVDTGAGFRGKLSVLEAHTGRYWQSDYVYELYPDEIGRNK